MVRLGGIFGPFVGDVLQSLAAAVRSRWDGWPRADSSVEHFSPLQFWRLAWSLTIENPLDATRCGVSEAGFETDHRQRLEKSLHRRAKELCYELRKIEPPAEAEPQPA